MRRHISFTLFLFVCSVMIGACSSINKREPATQETSTATSSPQPSQVLPTTTNESLVENIEPVPTSILQLGIDTPIPFGSEFSPCELPCWNGLRVNQSNEDDILAVWDMILGSSDSSGLVDGTQIDLPSLSELEVPESEPFGYLWDSSVDLFGLYMLTDTDTDILQGIFFLYVVSNESYEVRSITRIVQDLGVPTYIYGSALTRYDEMVIRIFMLYEQGMAFLSTYEVPVQGVSSVGSERPRAELCLDGPIDTGNDYIFSPIDSLDPQSLTPLQQEWLRNIVHPDAFYLPVEESFGITVEEFVEAALADNPCIQFDPESLKVISR